LGDHRRPASHKRFLLHHALLLTLLVFGAQLCASAQSLPATLGDTGLPTPGNRAASPLTVASFSPQYPLWTDDADKQRWLYLPRGTQIDATRPDAWEFPVGTRLWKQFSFGGKPVETRYIEKRGDGSWAFASYVWNADATQATLAPERGLALSVPGRPGQRHTIPSRKDCLACHGSAPVPVLGLSALQLSPYRDPLGSLRPRASATELDLRSLVEGGWLRGLPARLLVDPPRIPAANPTERFALGYLHGNCAHCHNTSSNRVPLALTFAQLVSEPSHSYGAVLASTVNQRGRYGASSEDDAHAIIVPGHPERSLLLSRMRSRQPWTQMPPLGSSIPDPDAIELISRWITNVKPLKENSHETP
jgi:hypothetical protein